MGNYRLPKHPDNVVWYIDFFGFNGPMPDWEDYRFHGSCPDCRDTMRLLVTKRKSNDAIQHKLYCRNHCWNQEVAHHIAPNAAASFEVYFGTHKGKRLDETPISWRQWVMKQDVHSFKSLQKKIIVLDGLSV